MVERPPDQRVGRGESRSRKQVVPIVMTMAGIAGALTHVVWPHVRIDAVTVALLAVALVPWLGGLLESVELPGGGKVNYRRFEARLAVAERQTAELGARATAASQVAQAALGAATGVEIAEQPGDAVSSKS